MADAIGDVRVAPRVPPDRLNLVEIILLWAGLAFVALGVSIVVLEAKAARGGVKTTGRVIGHAQRSDRSQAMYRAVIEFTDLRDRRRLAESNVGSSAPLGRVGDEVQVSLDPGDPDTATIVSPVTTVIGVVIALLGAAACGAFLLTFRPDPWSVAVSAVVTVVLAFKARRFLGQLPGLAAAWKEIEDKALRSRSFDAADRARIAWADPARLAVTVRRQERMNRVAWPVLLAAGAGLMVLGFHLQRTNADFLARAIPGSGRVVGLAENSSSDGSTWAAVVEFDVGGLPRRFKDSLASKPPVYRVGDVVPILFIREDPENARIDRGLWSRLLPWLVGAVGALLALGGLRLAVLPGQEPDLESLRPAA
jgi:hypothetical protein